MPDLTRLFFCGDTHANPVALRKMIEQCEEEGLDTVYQCGDFGYWPSKRSGQEFLDITEKLLAKKNMKLYWIDGNHEDHWALRDNFGGNTPEEHVISPHITHMGRGSTQIINGHKLLFAGGAWSIDKSRRTLGVDWFPEEMLTYKEVDTAIQNAEGTDILVTHDAPTGNYWLNNQLDGQNNMEFFKDSFYHRCLIKDIAFAAKPKLLIHGHWHCSYEDILVLNDEIAPIKIIGLNYEAHRGSWRVIELTNKME